MGWPFEHYQDGETFLHTTNWLSFKRHKESGTEYPHNWLHRRLFIQLHSPRNWINQIPLPEDNSLSLFHPTRQLNQPYQINYVSDDWSVIFDPYPAFVRTRDDPHGNQPSFHLWLEDKHQKPTYGEPVTLFSTGTTLNAGTDYIYACFRDLYWYVESFHDYGLGVKQPPIEEIRKVGTKKKLYRSIDD